MQGRSVRLSYLAALLIVLCGVVAAPSISLAQFQDHTVSPPTAPGPSALERDADAFMAGNGYQLNPGMTKYGSVSGNSPTSFSISLNPGKWAIAILNWNNSTCALDASFRDVGYTVGAERYPATQGPGFQYVPLSVESNLGGIALTMRDASFQRGDRFTTCGYELRFYVGGNRSSDRAPPASRAQPRCRSCESWNEQQQRCIQFRACY